MQYGIGHWGFSPRFLRQDRCEISSGIEIRGNAEFRLRTQQALALLRPLGQFEIIQANLGRIRQGKHSGMKAWAKPPTFIIPRYGTPAPSPTTLIMPRSIRPPRGFARAKSPELTAGQVRRRKSNVWPFSARCFVC
jgi:hypothetical protein